MPANKQSRAWRRNRLVAFFKTSALADLTNRLMSSIRSIGGAAGAEFPPRDETDSVERQIVLTARPALDALADYMLGLARQIITPRGRGNIGFDQPDPVSDDVSVLDRLIASPAGNR